MHILSAKGLFRIILPALLISIILIVTILILLNYPMLRTTDNLNIFLTTALVGFAFVEVLSTLSKANIEKKRKQTIDLRNELEKLYGPVYSVLNNIVCKEIRKGILTQREKELVDKTFSKTPFMFDCQPEWNEKILNREIRKTDDFDIPIEIIENFNKEYEMKKGEDTIEEQFGDIYSIFKNVPQETEEVGILSADEKTLIDKKFSNYPYMLNQELYDYWNKEIRSLENTTGLEFFGDVLTLYKNSRFNRGGAAQKTAGLYRVPKAFITKFLEEYDKKVREYRKP